MITAFLLQELSLYYINDNREIFKRRRQPELSAVTNRRLCFQLIPKGARCRSGR